MRKYGDHTDAYTDPKTCVLRNKLGLSSESSLERPYTGKILVMTDRHVAQLNDKTTEIVLNERLVISGLQAHHNHPVEIAYPAGRVGIVRETLAPESARNHELSQQHRQDYGERER
jgi:hypothetical protein